MQAVSDPPSSLSPIVLDDYQSYSPDTDSLLSFTPMGTVDDFFNFDLLGGGQSSSRGSSKSPTNSLWNLPSTPPNAPQVLGLEGIPEVREEGGSGLFGFYDVPGKHDDLFSMFEDAAMPNATPISSPELFGLRPASASSTAGNNAIVPALNLESAVSPSLFAIDPTLTATTPDSVSGPSVGTNQHSSAEDADIEEEDEEDLDAPTPASSSSHTIKVGGKGANNRKGTVVNGGIRKTSGPGGGIPMTQAVRREEDPLDEDDWRPTPEEYKKMSSKEKRQLRNKISARNFRVRRKEYITALEGDIAQRDTLIDAIRTELGNSKLENQTLRHEVEALKKALLKGGITPDLPPPAPISEAPPASVTNKPTRKALLAKANTHKDVSSTRAGNAFWGGAKPTLGGGFTSVHTTLVPDFAPLVTEKLAAKASLPLQENINPSLNANPFFGIGANAHIQDSSNLHKAGFDSFTDINPFTFKSLDAYRYHLWNKMATQNGSRNAQMGANNNNVNANGLYMQGLAGQLRPAYFASPKTSTLSLILSGKGSSSSPSEDSKPPSPSLPTPSSRPIPTPQQAALAALASQTLVQKLSSAFWDAFSSPSPPSPSRSKDWDQEKVRKVLEGKAVIRVVDVAPSSPTIGAKSLLTKDKESHVDSLEESMKSLAIGSQGGVLKSGGGEKVMMRSEPCFLQGLRAGTSALSGKKA